MYGAHRDESLRPFAILYIWYFPSRFHSYSVCPLYGTYRQIIRLAGEVNHTNESWVIKSSHKKHAIRVCIKGSRVGVVGARSMLGRIIRVMFSLVC